MMYRQIVQTEDEAISKLKGGYDVCFISQEVRDAFDWRKHLDLAFADSVYMDEDGYETCGSINAVQAFPGDGEQPCWMAWAPLQVDQVEEVLRILKERKGKEVKDGANMQVGAP